MASRAKPERSGRTTFTMSFTPWSTIPSLCAILLLAAEFLQRSSSRISRAPRTPRLTAWLWVVILIASYAAQLAIIYYTAIHEYPMKPWRLTMPLPVIDAAHVEIRHGNIVALAMLLLAALQTYALLGLYRARASTLTMTCGCALMLLLSICSPALISFDLYFYVHDALLGLAAYHPPKVPFRGEYHILDVWLGGPQPTLYGPLAVAAARLMTSVAPTLLGKLLALRFFDALWYLTLVAGLRALGMPKRIRNVVALNPGLMLQYVSNGHNDLMAIVALVWAAAVVRKSPVPAFGLITIAGLFKLPYVILGLPIAAAVRFLPGRIAGTAIAVVSVLAVSWAAGGAGYRDALGGHVRDYHPDLTQHVAGAVALVLIGAAWFRSRRLQTAVWIMPTLSAALYSWYFVWGLPYALARRRILGYLMICYPLVTTLVGSVLERTWELDLVLTTVVALSILASSKRPAATAGREQRMPVAS
jgi:hypothetical protein